MGQSRPDWKWAVAAGVAVLAVILLVRHYETEAPPRRRTMSRPRPKPRPHSVGRYSSTPPCPSFSEGYDTPSPSPSPPPPLPLYSSPTPCPPGTFCGTPGLASPAVCPPGFQCPAPQLAAALPCDPGFYCPAGTVAANPCALGSFCPAQSATELPCPAGQICATPASSAACPPGLVCPLGSVQGQACPAGSFCSNSGSTVCPPGTYCPANAPGAVPCPAGAYCPGPGLTDFLACPAGSFNPATRAVSVQGCQACPAGSSCAAPMSTQATPCAATGTFCPGTVPVSGTVFASSAAPAGLLRSVTGNPLADAGGATVPLAPSSLLPALVGPVPGAGLTPSTAGPLAGATFYATPVAAPVAGARFNPNATGRQLTSFSTDAAGTFTAYLAPGQAYAVVSAGQYRAARNWTDLAAVQQTWAITPLFVLNVAPGAGLTNSAPFAFRGCVGWSAPGQADLNILLNPADATLPSAAQTSEVYLPVGMNTPGWTATSPYVLTVANALALAAGTVLLSALFPAGSATAMAAAAAAGASTVATSQQVLDAYRAGAHWCQGAFSVLSASAVSNSYLSQWAWRTDGGCGSAAGVQGSLTAATPSGSSSIAWFGPKPAGVPGIAAKSWASLGSADAPCINSVFRLLALFLDCSKEQFVGVLTAKGVTAANAATCHAAFSDKFPQL